MAELYYVTTPATAAALAAAVDATAGYPAAGINIGGGVHVEPPFVTETYALVMVNPSAATEAAYPADAVSTPVVAANAVVALAGLPAPEALPWSTATAGGPTAAAAQTA